MSDFLENVEQHLKRISLKYESKKKVREISTGDLLEELHHLDQELDYLDVSYLVEPFNLKTAESTQVVLSQVTSSVFDLIRLHKDHLNQQDELIEKNCRLNNEIAALKKQIDLLKKTITSKERVIETSKNQNVKETQRNRELTNKIGEANKRITIIQQENRSNRTALTKINKKVNDENKVRNEKLTRDCGKYISNDKKIAQVLSDYENNEQKLKETVNKLQNTNQSLLLEVIELRNKLASK